MSGKVKNKNHSWAKKRFRITKNGKVLFDKSCNNHLLTNKGWNAGNHKKFPYGKSASKADLKNIKNLVVH